ncbi:hypothetical protein D3C74_289910 [compost metagenome]
MQGTAQILHFFITQRIHRCVLFIVGRHCRWFFINRAFIHQRRYRHITDNLAMMEQLQAAVIGYLAHFTADNPPAVKNLLCLCFILGFNHKQHPLLRLGQHHLVRRHAVFTLRYLIQIQLQAVARLARHFGTGAGQSGCAHILNTQHNAAVDQLQAGFHHQLFHKRIADLHRCLLGFRFLTQFNGGKSCAVNPVASGRRTYVEHRVAYTFGDTALDFVMIYESDAHGIDQRIAVIAVVEHNFAAHCRNPDTVAITSDTGYDMLEQILDPVAFKLPETQGVQQRHRSCTHGENVPDNPAHPGRRALVRLNCRRMVMAFNFEYNSLIVSDIYDPGAFPRSHQHARPARRETAQQRLRVLIGTVLRPHYTEHTDFRIVWLAAHERSDELIFAVRHTELTVDFLLRNLLCGRLLSGYLLRHNDPSMS